MEERTLCLELELMIGGTYLVFGAGAAVVSVFVFRGAGTVMFGGTYLVFGAGADDWRNVPCVWSWSCCGVRLCV